MLVSKMLDKVASSLESKGLYREALDLDMISNGIEAGTKYFGSPKEIFKKLSDKTLIFFDTETTGLDNKINQVTEIGALAVKAPEFEIIGTFHKGIELTEETLKLIKEEEGIELPKGKLKIIDILKMTDYYGKEEIIKGTEKDVIEEFVEFCGKYPDAVLVAQNASFDLKMLSRVSKLKGREVIDTVRLSGYYIVPILEALRKEGTLEQSSGASSILKDMTNVKGEITTSLGKILPALGGKIENWHTALGDVKSTIMLYRLIMKFIEDNIDMAESDTFAKSQAKAKLKEKKYKGYDRDRAFKSRIEKNKIRRDKA